MIKIHTQQDLDSLLTLPNWESAFVREAYLLSPSYVNPLNQGTIAADSAPSFFILISTTSKSCAAIELLFDEVEEIHLSFRNDLNPAASIQNGLILFSFHREESPDLRSKSLYYRILDQDSWGCQVRYGVNNFFDPSGFLMPEILS